MSMNAFVIKSWSASDSPASDGSYINIDGRAGGFVSFLLNLLGISPTVRLVVRADKVAFQQGSLEGTFNFLTPLENICSTFYAFKRPLKESVFLGVFFGALTFWAFAIPGIVIGILYYALNKRLTIGFTDIGGRLSQIPFKRSVIDGRDLDETQAARVCEIMERLVDVKRGVPQAPPAVSFSPRLASTASSGNGNCPSCGNVLPEVGKFCAKCGAPITARSSAAAG
jgi:hypothetical protein